MALPQRAASEAPRANACVPSASPRRGPRPSHARHLHPIFFVFISAPRSNKIKKEKKRGSNRIKRRTGLSWSQRRSVHSHRTHKRNAPTHAPARPSPAGYHAAGGSGLKFSRAKKSRPVRSLQQPTASGPIKCTHRERPQMRPAGAQKKKCRHRKIKRQMRGQRTEGRVARGSQ